MNGQSHAQGPTDVVALAVAVAAASLALSGEPGPYDWLSIMTSATLSIVILSFVWQLRRTPIQSLATALAFALTVVPGIGFFLETWGEAHNWSPFKDGSRVPTYKIAVGWLITAGLFLVVDRCRQNR